MRIHNVRLGLATNSSSTHSLIFLQDAQDAGVECDEFGWNHFTAASEETRRAYFGQILFSNLQEMTTSKVAAMIVQEWIGDKISFEDSGYAIGYVDHQSVYTMPRNWDEQCVDEEFAKEFLSYMLRENLVILGGNDNDDGSHPLADGTAFVLPLRRDERNKGLVCRKDPRGFWSLFNRTTGAKFRISFQTAEGVVAPVRATYPELVDVKITDFCPIGCAYCYQDSTVSGMHAGRQTISSIAHALSDMRVFEVAIGGGEPTMHPGFEEILRTFRSCGIVPNFTTKSLAWLQDENRRREILDETGAFAYSVTDSGDIDKLAALTEVYDIPSRQVAVQYVMGTAGDWEFKSILRAADYHRIRLTLLGYKTVGRGDQFKPRDDENAKWLSFIQAASKKHRCPTISIDTALAQKYEEQIKAAGIPEWMFHTEEGRFSCYIDAVGKLVGPSSFCNPDEMVKVDPEEGFSSASIVDIFDKF